MFKKATQCRLLKPLVFFSIDPNKPCKVRNARLVRIRASVSHGRFYWNNTMLGSAVLDYMSKPSKFVVIN